MTQDPNRWQHLEPFIYQLFKERIQRYDEIMEMTEDKITSISEKFLQAIELCIALKDFECEPSDYPCDVINLFCQVAESPTLLIQLLNQYPVEVKKADQAIINYVGSIDNWRGKKCPFGIKDHCNIVHFFLNLNGSYQDQLFFRGANFTPEVICEFLQEWKGINLFPFVSKELPLVTN
ncbi:MAG: hypothetical protein VKJ02_10865 [Snowella sp.]|nr:hypothetical protein [Snowella sp.]